MRWLQAGILLACLLAHGVVLLWLLRPSPVRSPQTSRTLVVEFVSIPAKPVEPPPFPQAPVRKAAEAPLKQKRPPTPSAPPDMPATPLSRPTPPAPNLDTARLLDIAGLAARASVEADGIVPRDPTRRYPAKLPGRVEPYTPEAIQLRDPLTPQKVVAFVGGLFGGNYDPCPDTRSKLHDLTTRNRPEDAEEIRQLIDRERRRCR